jgi:cytochrome c biogenesis protein CcmG, thiol:disulfide interchange protein DsbE
VIAAAATGPQGAARVYPGGVFRRSRARPALALAAATALTFALACTDRRAEGTPAYTRVEGRAPEVLGRGAGATLVVFWATWCPPCREELPGLLALARDPPPGISLLTFGEDEAEGPVRAFFGGAPPPELGLRPDAHRRAAEAFGVDALPAAFLVVNGALIARFEGPRDWRSSGMRRLLARLASEPSPREAPGAGVPR